MKWGFLDDDSGYFYCIIYNLDIIQVCRIWERTQMLG